ncbi:hypothetical protein PROFUN_01569 [Planoprotostelium fungivorum]|uniref:Uncharacterized protein n=1 Tax=Planoprotostelium fungivorum TaxID=1890364 RepID=A0A2P6NTK0_9EUKA|nr:hypothetical protein PROFUN_01569 [Planoprotostelium fungivorum]
MKDLFTVSEVTPTNKFLYFWLTLTDDVRLDVEWGADERFSLYHTIQYFRSEAKSSLVNRPSLSLLIDSVSLYEGFKQTGRSNMEAVDSNQFCEYSCEMMGVASVWNENTSPLRLTAVTTNQRSNHHKSLKFKFGAETLVVVVTTLILSQDSRRIYRYCVTSILDTDTEGDDLYGCRPIAFNDFTGRKIDDDIDDTNVLPKERKPSNLEHFRSIPFKRQPQPHLTFFQKHHGVPIFRGVISVLIGSALVYIPETSGFYGRNLNLMTLVITLYDYTQTRGSAVQSVFFFLVGFCIAAAVCTFSTWFSDVYQKEYIILWLWLFTIFFAYARVKLPPKWTTPVVMGHFTFVNTSLINLRHDDQLGYRYVFTTFLGMVTGPIISTIVSQIIRPRSGAHSLRKEMKGTMKTIRILLQSTSEVWMGTSTDDTQNDLIHHEKRIRGHFTTLTKRLEALRWEFRSSRWTDEEIVSIVNFLQQTLVHVRSMGSSCKISNHVKSSNVNIERMIYHIGPSVLQIKTHLIRMMESVEESLHLSEGFTLPRESYANKRDAITSAIHQFHVANDEITKDITREAGGSNAAWDDVPLVYFYVFSLLECGRELLKMADFVEEANKAPSCHLPRAWKHTVRRFLGYFHCTTRGGYAVVAEVDEKEPKQERKYEKKGPEGLKKAIKRRFRKFNLNVYNAINVFTSKEAKYAYKVGIAILLTTMWQYVPHTRQTYLDWRGEWAAVTVVNMFSPTAGSNFLDTFLMIFGGTIGAGWAVVSWLVFPHDPYGLTFTMFLIAFYSFYAKMNPKYPRVGTVTMATYGIVILEVYYSHGNPNSHEIYELAYKRIAATAYGAFVILVVDRFMWPHLARIELRRQLSSLLKDLALIYSGTFRLLTCDDERLADQVQKAQTSASVQLVKADALIRWASIEPRLKGPYPTKMYKKIVQSIELLLDRTVTARVAARHNFSKKFQQTVTGEKVTQCLLLFWMTESSILWKKRLPRHLPDLRTTRHELMTKMTLVEYFSRVGEVQGCDDLIHYFTWLNASMEISVTLEELVQVLKVLYGEEHPLSHVVVQR